MACGVELKASQNCVGAPDGDRISPVIVARKKRFEGPSEGERTTAGQRRTATSTMSSGCENPAAGLLRGSYCLGAAVARSLAIVDLGVLCGVDVG